MPLDEKLLPIIQEYGKHPEFLGIEIADVNQRGAVDDTLLHIAARKGDIRAVNILVECGADVNSRGDLGNTPLHQAAMFGEMESVRKLLVLGANTELENEFGQKPADVASLGGYDHIRRVLKG